LLAFLQNSSLGDSNFPFPHSTGSTHQTHQRKKKLEKRMRAQYRDTVEETKQTQGEENEIKGRKQRTKPSFGLVPEFMHNTE